MNQGIFDKNVVGYKQLISPIELKQQFPLERKHLEIVKESRKMIEAILDRYDTRKIIIVGPCSIHDPVAALDYAKKLKQLSDKVKDQFLIIMRTYFEKPRTSLGWKGLIYDPYLDGSNKIEDGLAISRKLLLDITELGIPTATEFLGTLIPQYFDDLICWAAIGARTTESQPHREMASGLSMPVGFKNSTYGEIETAVNSIKSAMKPHTFVGVDYYGRSCIVETKGNRYCHLILRGGNGRPNYNPELVQEAVQMLEKSSLPKNIIIDCSHGNTNKNYALQPEVFNKVLQQILNKNENIIGMMLESFIYEGNQEIPKNNSGLSGLKYGVSVTDGCISFELTETLILNAYEKIKELNKVKVV